MDRKYSVIRYIAYGLEILILYIIQGTPMLIPEVLGGRPLILIPVALTIAFFESEVTAMAFGLACGVMLDVGTGGNIGFYSITLTIICFIIGNIFRDYMVVNILNAMAFCAGCTLGILCLYFLLLYIFTGKGDIGYYFVFHYLSKIVYTMIFSPLLYFINKGLSKGLRDV